MTWPENHHLFWKLVGKLAVPCTEMEWLRWFEKSADRKVDCTIIGPIGISTVCLGMNHNYGPGDPLIFETMIFRGGESCECWRSSSWEEAEADHKRAVELIRREIKEDAI